MTKSKKLNSMLQKVHKHLKHSYHSLVVAESNLDVDCGLSLARHLFPDKVRKIEVAQKVVDDWFLLCLRIENAIGYLEV